MRRVFSFARRSARLLAVESDGFSLRAAVVTTERNGVVVERVAESREAEMATAFEEAIGHLRTQGADLPRRAILLTVEAIPAVLSIPVHPRRPKPADQMQSLIRWEMEPHLAQQVASRPIGAILICRGALTWEQSRQVLLLQETERRKGPSSTPPRPFGQIAVALGFITAAQVQEALAIQERFQIGDGATVCGWSPQSESTAPAGKTYRWLVCSVSRSLRERWVERFSCQRLRLEGIYPLVGCSAAMLDGAVSTPTAGVLEVHPGLLGYVGLASGTVDLLRMAYMSGEPLSLRMCLGLIGKETGAIWWAGGRAGSEALPAEIAAQIQPAPRGIPVGVRAGASETTTLLAGIAGAARHAFRLPGGARAVCVSARDPAPPPWERVGMWWVAAACALALLIGGLELLLVADSETRARLLERKRLEQRVTEQRQALDALASRRAFLEQRLPQRQTQLLGLLDALAGTVPEAVVIDRLEETDREAVDTGGRALSEEVVQRFAQALAARVKPLGLAVTDLNVRTQSLRTGGPPRYVFTLRLTPT